MRILALKIEMEQELYILRHGRTDYNRRRIWQGRSVDASLDEVGKMQASKFFERYKTLDFSLIISSQLRRSIQTIKPFSDFGIKTIHREELNEISWGKYEGLPHTKESLLAYQRITKQWQSGNYEVGFPGGETARDLEVRLKRFRDQLLTFADRNILICSHGRAMRALFCVLQNNPLSLMEQYAHDNTGLFKFTRKGDRYELEFSNNVDHLEVSR